MTGEKTRMSDGGVSAAPKTVEDKRQSNTVTAAVGSAKFDKPTVKIKIKTRFAGLKKSLRKRSASIL